MCLGRGCFGGQCQIRAEFAVNVVNDVAREECNVFYFVDGYL